MSQYSYYSTEGLYNWRAFCFKYAVFILVCSVCPAALGLAAITELPILSAVCLVIFIIISGVGLTILLDGVECEMELDRREKMKEAEEFRKFETMLYD